SVCIDIRESESALLILDAPELRVWHGHLEGVKRSASIPVKPSLRSRPTLERMESESGPNQSSLAVKTHGFFPGSKCSRASSALCRRSDASATGLFNIPTFMKNQGCFAFAMLRPFRSNTSPPGLALAKSFQNSRE